MAAEARGANTVCPGCGLTLPPCDWPLPDGYAASRECFERFGQLSSYTLGLRGAEFSHQYVVDAYALQHAGGSSTPIGIFFALVGLYLASERGFSGREVQRAHGLLAERKRKWPTFTVPAKQAAMTVNDVLAAAAGPLRDAAIRQWASAVWAAWKDEHARVRQLVHEYVPNVESARSARSTT